MEKFVSKNWDFWLNWTPFSASLSISRSRYVLNHKEMSTETAHFTPTYSNSKSALKTDNNTFDRVTE